MATVLDTRSTGAHRRRQGARPSRPQPGIHAAAGARPAARWELPALLAVLAAAALLYTWDIGHAAVHPYYGAAIRSMASSWRAFFYGGLDSSGSITIDKVPGAFWPDAVSVWLFGPHSWAAALPHAIEGVLTVLVLHRIVRAWAGPIAALIAALALTATPATAALNRATLPDTLLTLLLVLAAGSLQKALRTGRLLPLLACGLWVGLAFQVKMLQAWLVLPVFAAVYLLAAPGGVLRRSGQVLLAGMTALAASCYWALLVWSAPAADRPYLDGTTNNNPFTMIFGYNGVSRFGNDPTAFGSVPGTAASRTLGNTGWTMLVNHTVGPQIAWLLPPAVLAAVLGVLWRTGLPRGDQVRAGYLLWGGWLAVHAIVFGSSNGNHGYYTAVIAPSLAALTGAGLAAFWDAYRAPRAGWHRSVLPAVIALTTDWAVTLDRPTLFVAWLLPVTVMLAMCSVTTLWFRGPRIGRHILSGAMACGVAAVLVLPAGWAVSTLDPGYAGAATAPLAGPVGSDYLRTRSHSRTVNRTGLDRPTALDTAVLGYLTKHRSGEKYLFAAQSAYAAEPLLRASSEPVLVMGGFTGLVPFPNAQQLADLVTDHQVRYAMLTAARPTSSATTWVKAHCTPIPPSAFGRQTGGSLTLYDCRPDR